MSIRLPSPFLTIRFPPAPPSPAPRPSPPASRSRDRATSPPPCRPYAHAARPAGVRGKITRFVTTIPSASSTYHFYELDVASLDTEWLESGERRREWVDYAEAHRRLSWKTELAQGLALSSLAPKR